LADEQAEKGLVPVIVPDMIPVRTSIAGWGDAATVVPWVLYERTGDTDVLRRQYDSMKGWVEQVLARVDEQGLWESGLQLGDWLDPAAPPADGSAGRTDRFVVASAYLVRSLRIMADTARLMDHEQDHRRYLDIWDRTRQAFRRRYITPEGRVMSDSPAAYAIALCFGLLNEPERAAAGERLNALVKRDEHRIGTGFLGTPLVCDALADTGHVDTAYRMLLQTEAPSWLYAVRMGATTIWERWDSMLPDGTVNPEEMTSFNHYAFGAVADWLHRCVAGLEPMAPGYTAMRIRPRPGKDITWARTRHISPHGETEVHWTIEDGLFKLEATVPPNATAEVHLPGCTPLQVGSGRHEWAVPWAVPAEPGPTVDTALPVLRSHPELWARLAEVVEQVDPATAKLLDSPALVVIRARTLRDVLGLSRHYRALVEAAGTLFDELSRSN
jgi:alpha-L-rhamnosidase